MNTNKNGKTLVIAMVAILLIITLFIGFRKNNKENEIKEEKVKQTVKTKDNWYKPSGDAAIIEIYYIEKDNSYVSIKENEDKSFIDSSYKLVNTYNCTVSSCSIFPINSNKAVIKDDVYVLYDINKNKAKKIDLPVAMYNDIGLLSSNGKDYGLSVSNINNMYAFYSFKENKFTTEFKYSNIYTLETDGLAKGYISTVISSDSESKYYIINYKDDSILYESDVYIGITGNKNKVYFYKNYADLSGIDAVIYDEKFKELFGEEQYQIFGVSDSGNVVLKDKDKNTFSIYNEKGIVVKTSKEYKDILMIVKNYVIVVDIDDFLKVVDYDGNVKAKFNKLTKDYVFYNEISGLFFHNENVILNIYLENTRGNEKNTITKFYYVPKTKEKGKIDL